MNFFSLPPRRFYCPTCRKTLQFEDVEFERCEGGGPVHRIVIQDGPDELHEVIELKSDRA